MGGFSQTFLLSVPFNLLNLYESFTLSCEFYVYLCPLLLATPSEGVTREDEVFAQPQHSSYLHNMTLRVVPIVER